MAAGVVALLMVCGVVRAEPLLQSEAPVNQTPDAAPINLQEELEPLRHAELLDATPPATNPHALPARATPLPALTATAADTEPSLHSTLKEAVRPVYNELQEAGVIDTLRELKSDLGLGKNTWDHAPNADTPVNTTPSADAPPPAWDDPATRPKSAAQARLDREYEAYVLEQLIDDIKPWVLGAIGIYLLAQLIKMSVNFIQWKAARRRERRLARAKRHRSSGRHRSTESEG